MIDLLPPPLVATPGAPPSSWTSYVTPAATWQPADLPVLLAPAGGAPPKVSLEAFAAALDVAARAWAVPTCSGARLSIVAARPTAGPLDADGRNDVIVHTTDWPSPLTPGAAGHTVIFVTGGRVVEADIHLNARDFAFVLGKAPPAVDLRAILTHELGHVLGIGHSDDARATMHAGLPAGIAARSLEADDVTAVCALYAATGPTSTCTSCPTGYACVGQGCETPGEPGTLGAPCTATTDVRRCEGAGDVARCALTTVGERCVVPCEGGACGVGLDCVKDSDGFGACLPSGATFATADAGPDAAPPDGGTDGGTDAAPAPGGGGGGCGCRLAGGTAPGVPSVLLALAAAAISRRARGARAQCRCSHAKPPRGPRGRTSSDGRCP